MAWPARWARAYLPVPGDHAPEVQDLLEELGLRQRVAGRWQYDERHLCHSPQERLYFEREWQEGLLPVQGVGEATLEQYRRFSQAVGAASRAARFTMPQFAALDAKTGLAPAHQALDAMTFEAWLQQQGLDDAHLRWYLDYCCRDDYGAGMARVSAWAGLHYFASRHGFHAPGEAVAEDREGVLTWPEGNGWLTQQLAARSRRRASCKPAPACCALPKPAGVEVDAFNHHSGNVERWQAPRCVGGAAGVCGGARGAKPACILAQAAQRLQWAPWAVTNIHLNAPLADRPGAAPAWDNVIYGDSNPGGLGYVDASHQKLDPRPGPTVLTYYQALGDVADARQQLATQGAEHWAAPPWPRWLARTPMCCSAPRACRSPATGTPCPSPCRAFKHFKPNWPAGPPGKRKLLLNGERQRAFPPCHRAAGLCAQRLVRLFGV